MSEHIYFYLFMHFIYSFFLYIKCGFIITLFLNDDSKLKTNSQTTFMKPKFNIDKTLNLVTKIK